MPKLDYRWKKNPVIWYAVVLSVIMKWSAFFSPSCIKNRIYIPGKVILA
jgi:hypothetical protein